MGLRDDKPCINTISENFYHNTRERNSKNTSTIFVNYNTLKSPQIKPHQPELIESIYLSHGSSKVLSFCDKTSQVKYGKSQLKTLQEENNIRILGDIVGATNLECLTLPSDSTLPNPYCNVYWGDRLIHRTQTIPKNYNPIWTCDTGSLFLMSGKRDYRKINNMDLRIELFDRDIVRKRSTRLGVVYIPGRKLINGDWCNEVRIECEVQCDKMIKNDAFISEIPDVMNNTLKCDKCPTRIETKLSSVAPLMVYDQIFSMNEDVSTSEIDSIFSETERKSSNNPESLWNIGSKGFIALRFRFANDEDILFLRALKTDSKLIHDRSLIGKNLAEFPTENCKNYSIKYNLPNIMRNLRNKFRRKKVNPRGKKLLRVKPRPDPGRPIDETKFLSKEDLINESFSSSTQWTEAGSGSLGSVLLEIICCEDLKKNSMDQFVCIVFEDCMVQTDILRDCLNPRWMPWTQRAFVFRRMYQLSSMYIGVINYNVGMLNHKGCGRTVIDLSAFTEGTVYTLKYALYSSSNTSNRQSKGTITIRLRIVNSNPKDHSFAASISLPDIYVNVKKRESLKVARYTVYGKYNEDIYSMKVLRSYIDELFEYMEFAIYSSKDFILSLIFWRGQVYVGSLHLPLHSVVAFLSSVYAIETPRLLPSFFLFSISYCMLILMVQKQSHPSPWYRCKPFGYSLFRFLNLSLKTSIQPGEGAEQSEALKVSWKEKIEHEKEMQSEISRLRSEIQKVLVGMGKKISIQTREEGDSLNPLTRLLPIQLLLKDFLFYIRLIKVVISWEETFFSLCFTCFTVVIGSLFLFLPFFSILHVLARFLVWTFLGPWMRFVDVIYFRKKSEKLKSMINTVRDREQQIWKNTRLEREKMEKLKSIRTVCFGKYSFKVPALNLTWHKDRPLPDSSAKRIDEDDPYIFVSSLNKARKIVPGQKNDGVMIPRIPQYSTTKVKTFLEDVLPRCGNFPVEENEICYEKVTADDGKCPEVNLEGIIPLMRNKSIESFDYVDEGIEIILSYRDYEEIKNPDKSYDQRQNDERNSSNEVCISYTHLNENQLLQQNYKKDIPYSCNILIVNKEDISRLSDNKDEVEIILLCNCDDAVKTYESIPHYSNIESTVSPNIINLSFSKEKL